jgi:hypothetical protein
MENLVDIVYVIGTGSRWDSNELKYSLRSIEKHGINTGKIIIVGYLPDWIEKTRVIHIPESFEFYKERNIMECIRLACKDSRVSSNFIYFNDDFYLNQNVDWNTLPTYTRDYDLHKYVWGEFHTKVRWNKYTRIIERTYQVLNKRGLPILTYDIHIPMPINKDKFLEAMNAFDWNCPHGLGYTYRSIYGNYHQIPAIPRSDVKYHKIHTYEGFLKSLEGKDFFSTADTSDNRHLQSAFDILYPNKSWWEK